MNKISTHKKNTLSVIALYRLSANGIDHILNRFSYSQLAVLITSQILTASLLHSSPARADDYFDPSALEIKDQSQQAVDLDQFSRKGGQLPGVYHVDIYLNGTQVDTADMRFDAVKGVLQAQFTVAQLADLGVKTGAFPPLAALTPDQTIVNLGEYIPDASADFDFANLRVNISIPQAALDSHARGYVDPKDWDQGLPALLLNYNFTGSNTWNEQRSGSDQDAYLNLRSGLNLGAWRLRNYSTYSSTNGQQSWDSISTYLQRDVQFLKSQLTLGESYTPGEVFDSIQFRGAQMASDDNMYPDSLRGFAPIIRGIAQSNAQVSIRQNGYTIYQTYVAPGAFEITDLYPTSASGDLEVVIKEADGSERVSVQPFSAVPIMQREGRLKYSLTAGEYRSSSADARQPGFAQTTLIYGLPHDTSVYGGLLASENYTSLLAGIGHGFGDWGSISLDATQAQTQLQNSDKTDSGQSYRFQYSKDINATGTTFTLAGYRYSTGGYYDFKESNELGFTGTEADAFRTSNNKRSRAQLNVSQSVGELGSFYISAYQQDYWQQSGYERSVNLGWNINHNNISYGLNYSNSKTPGSGNNDQIIAFNVQIPLSKWLANSWANYSISNSQKGKTTQRAGMSGTALTENNLNYSVQESYGNQGEGNGGNASASYRGTYGQINAGYSYDKDSRRVNYGVQGGIVAHPYGVTLSQPLGDTVTLVRAPGASDVKVQNNTGVRTDWRGYTALPYATPYRKNRVALDTSSLGDGVDITTSSQTVIPTNGAVVLADFETRVGSRVLFSLLRNGKPLPFGAMVSLVQEKGKSPNTGIVDDNGEVYLSGVPAKGTLDVKWGNEVAQQCKARFSMANAVDNASSIKTLKVTCQ